MSFPARVVLALVLVSSAPSQGALAPASASTPRSDLIATLNERFQCRLSVYTEGERLTFGRTMSPPSCPVPMGDYEEASLLLNTLADTVAPADASDLREQARQIEDVGQIYRRLRDLENTLGAEGVLGSDGRLLHLGHPFEQSNHTDQLWGYALEAAELQRRHLECVDPACDPFLLKLAKAITEKPEPALSGNRIVAPDSYDFGSFSQRYASDSLVRSALGLTLDWDWSPQNFSSHYRPEDGTLVFAGILPDGSAILTIAGWEERTEFPDVLPLFYLFQEAQVVFRHLQALPQKSTVAAVREIRFQPYREGGTLVDLDEPVAGSVRLSLSVLHPPDSIGVEAVREALLREITGAFKNYELSSQPTASVE